MLSPQVTKIVLRPPRPGSVGHRLLTELVRLLAAKMEAIEARGAANSLHALAKLAWADKAVIKVWGFRQAWADR